MPTPQKVFTLSEHDLDNVRIVVRANGCALFFTLGDNVDYSITHSGYSVWVYQSYEQLVT